MENKPKGSKSGLKFFSIIVVILVITTSFVCGFYFGAWQIMKIQSNSSQTGWVEKIVSLLSGTRQNSQLFQQVWQAINEKFVNRPVDSEQAFYGAMQGIVASLQDPYSSFFNPEETEAFKTELSGNFEGIGAELGIKNNQLTVIAPLPDTPAAKAGLKAGDKILKIENQDTANMSLDQAISLIRGEKGTSVKLLIQSDDQTTGHELSIERDVITVKSVEYQLKADNVAYIKISNFSDDTFNEFNKIAGNLIISQPKGIIIDLRDNPGGYLDSAVDIAGEFLDKQVVVIEDFQSSKKEYKSQNNAKLKEYKPIVLVNGGSASASEILAGALQDYQQATLVGETTFGKGTVQDYEQYSDGSSLKLTVAKWLTPKGRSIDKSGIEPDIKVLLTTADYNSNLDPQLDKALELLNK